MKNHSTVLSAVRYVAVDLRPYYARTLSAMTLVPMVEMQYPMAIDRYGRVYVNMNVVNARGKGGWSVEQSAVGLIHELRHFLCDHFGRSDPILAAFEGEALVAERDIVNIAQDMEINDEFLTDKDLSVPPDLIYPKTYGQPDGKLWEEYYKALRSRLLEERTGRTRCDCGSGAAGGPREFELGPPSDQAPGLTPIEAELVRRQAAADILQAGTAPLGAKMWAEGYLAPPKVPWERELRAETRRSLLSYQYGHEEDDWSRQSRRRQPHDRILRPGTTSPQVSVAVVLDTSGSMTLLTDADQSLVYEAVSEVQGIARSVGQQKICVLCCDSQSYDPQWTRTGLDISLIGGGGTNMGVGIAAAEKLKVQLVVVLTDGETPWPVQAPSVEVLVGLVGKSKDRRFQNTVPSYVKKVIDISGHAP